MPDPLRRSGGATTLYFARDTVFPFPHPTSDEFLEKLGDSRFRSIQTAASEETSVGWVTPADPSGDMHLPGDMEAGRATWLRVRIDKKELPKSWVRIYRAASEKAAGRKLSPSEVRELKADLAEQLLPQTLPKVSLVDALLVPKERLILLLSTSSGTVDAFCGLFFKTFGVPLEPADPYRRVYATGLPKKLTGRLERLAPVEWPVEGGSDG